MGRQVTKCPSRVIHYAQQMLGYMKAALSWTLHYGKLRSVVPGELHFVGGEAGGLWLALLPDASFGPPSTGIAPAREAELLPRGHDDGRLSGGSDQHV